MGHEGNFKELVHRILSCQLLSEEDGLANWNKVVNNAQADAIYSASSNFFQERYMAGVVEKFYNLSLVLIHDFQPVGVWPLALKQVKGMWSLGSNASSIIAPLFIEHLSEKVQKDLIRVCLKLLADLAHEYKIEEWWTEHQIREKGADAWWRALLPMTDSVRLTTKLYVDLKLPYETIWLNIRKSYRPLITKGRKLWKVEVQSQFDQADFDEFRKLHLTAAGRVTRSDASWEAHAQAIRNGEAFLVILRDGAGMMVGAGLFELTHYAGVYSVAAYNRDLFDLPLGHVVQVAAIEYMQKLGLSWYSIGRRWYPVDIPMPTDKEINIGVFTEGFATHIFPMISAAISAKQLILRT